MGGSFDVRVMLMIDDVDVAETSLLRVPSVGEQVGVLSTEGRSVSTQLYLVEAVERRAEKIYIHVHLAGAPTP